MSQKNCCSSVEHNITEKAKDTIESINNIKNDIAEIKDTVTELKDDIIELKGDIAELNEDFVELSSLIKSLIYKGENDHIKNSSKGDIIQSSKTTVVRIRRKGGKIVQGCDVYIGRKVTMGGWDLKRSKWANPFKHTENDLPNEISDEGKDVKEGEKEEGIYQNECLRKYRDYVLNSKELLDSLHELKGKSLGCWCKPNDCHGDVLIDLIKKMNI